MGFRNIAVSGRIAVGASTLAKQLSQTLGWPLRDASQIFRDISAQSCFDLEKNPQKYADDIDSQVDNETISNLKSLSHLVVASKLAGFLSRDIPHVYRVLVTCPLQDRVQRYSRDRGYVLAEARRLLFLREREDRKKWGRLYGHRDFFDPSFFHVTLNSGKFSVEEEIQEILRFLAVDRES